MAKFTPKSSNHTVPPLAYTNLPKLNVIPLQPTVAPVRPAPAPLVPSRTPAGPLGSATNTPNQVR
jgi:hypothetical protein